MRYTFCVVFEGVLGWVPDKPFFKKKKLFWKPGEASTLSVVIPDLREPRLAHWESTSQQPPNPRYRASHVPVLLVNPLDVVSSRRFPPVTQFQDPRTGALRSVYLLDRVVVKLPDLGKLEIESTVPNTAKPPKKDGPERRSLWWMPRLRSISKEARYAKKAVVTAPPDEFKRLGMSARIETAGGKLATIGFNRKGEDTWRFESVRRDSSTLGLKFGKQNMWRRAIGNRFALTGTLEKVAKVRITNAKGAKRLLELRPREIEGRPREVEITIANVEPEVLFMGEEHCCPR